MWTRSELKQRGKSAFLRNYGITVLVTFDFGIPDQENYQETV